MNRIAENMTAMVVDDEKDICYFLSSYLKKNKLNCLSAMSITEATELLDHHNPDILFIDNHLPDGYGVDMVAHIRKNHPGTVIVMISAYDSAEDKRNAFDHGVDHFLSKPFSLDEVSALLKDILGN